MRVLFAVSPALGHLFPMVSTAWALRARDHEVIVAASGTATTAAVSAGLPAVDVAPGVDFHAIFGQGSGTAATRAKELRDRGKAIARAGGDTPDFVLPRFAKVSDLMADGTVRLADAWRPDLVIYSKLQGAGLLVASWLNVPAVEHGFGFARDGSFASRFLPHLEPSYARHEVPLALPHRAVVHVAPPSMMIGSGDAWSMRYVPYNAGGLLPRWSTEPRSRPRVGVTLGTVVPQMAGTGGLAGLITAAAGLAADFVLALGDGADVAELGPLPPNVRVAGWVPLASLLAGCDAVVHHGGAGTTMTALCAGIPQLVLPHGADQFVNAAVVSEQGAGLAADPDEVDAQTISTLLTAERLRAAARRVRAEIASLPTPADLAPRFEELVADRLSVEQLAADQLATDRLSVVGRRGFTT